MMGSQTRRSSKVRIRDANLDDPDDVAGITRVYFDGFSTTVFHQLLYPGGASVSAQEQYIRTLRADLSPEEHAGASPVRYHLKVAELLPDDDGEEEEEEEEDRGEEKVVAHRETTKIIAIVKWKYVSDPLSPKAWHVKNVEQLTQEELGEGAHIENWRTFLRSIRQVREALMCGSPCLHLGTLVCLPDYRGLGAASALVRWGTELADQQGIPAWLEASPEGYPLYEKFGFETVDVLDLPFQGTAVDDEWYWGGDLCVSIGGEKPKGCCRTAIMKRLPR